MKAQREADVKTRIRKKQTNHVLETHNTHTEEIPVVEISLETCATQMVATSYIWLLSP